VLACCATLAVLVAFVFGQTANHDFVNYDDGDYVTKNAQVSRGLTFEGIFWAFTHVHSANWHPLTWISHMIDCQLYGLNAGGHHLTNVLLHAVNAILLFLLLRQMTRTLWPSALVAALFAIHPLRVESVAWVSERKDLLSGLFFLLTLMAYLRYARSPSRSRYVAVTVLFALGLMSKPMLVSLPIVLLLLDHWPLNRLDLFSLQRPEERKTLWQLLREKLPWLGLTVASCVITVIAQQGSIQPVSHISFPARIANATLSYVDYLRQMFWPADLAVLYPWDPSRLTPSVVAIAFFVLLAVSVLAVVARRRRYLLTGWLWYVVMLLPVIGIMHVGNQSHADRYTYLPQIGIYLMLVWAAVELCTRWRFLRVPVTVVACLAVVGLVSFARAQAASWQDSESLWTHALGHTTDNIIAEGNMGLALHAKGKDAEAMQHFERSLIINRKQPQVLSSLGSFYLDLGRVDDSLAVLKEALTLEPRLQDAHYNLGNTYLEIGNAAQALAHYQRALEIHPDDTEALNNRAWILATWPNPSIRDGAKAVALAERADSLLNKRNQVVAATLAAAYAETGRFAEAVRAAERALQLAITERHEARVRSIRGQLETYKSRNAFRDNRFLGR
jgi:tetratricopeptide (TPR) repeat protein